MKPGFVVFALPRSRTAWLSQFLSYGDWTCGHDQLRYMRSLDDVKAWLSLEKTGTCETGASPFWRLIHKYRSDLQIVTIRRPVEEVVESLVKAGLRTDPAIVRKAMTGLDRKLDQIEGRLPNVLSIPFNSLKNETVCSVLFEHCTDYVHDAERWKLLDAANIQVNFPAQVRYVTANLLAINRLLAQAKQEMLRDFASKPSDMTGFIIQEEPFSDYIRDCQHLHEQHCAIIGEHPDNWRNKNLPLMAKLYDQGFLQVMVGRSNGKPFGYLVTLVVPSLELHNTQTSQHMQFFAAPEAPGLGLKLQRAALAALKKKGVHEIFMRAGIRGNGDRMCNIYKRIGAQDFGRMYRVGLEN